MKELNLTLVVALMLFSQLLNAQDIFKQHGFDKEPLTLSNGQYNEFFDNEEVVQIGTILLNTRTNKVTAFIEEDTTKTKYLAEHSSRWLSIDPLAAKYPQVSPYVFCANNPIKYVDLDGRDYGVRFNQDNKTVTISATYYAISSDMASANQAASTFNNLSGSYTYTVGKGDAATSYKVNFDVKAVEVAVDSNIGEIGSLNSALNADNSGEGNVYKVVSDSKLGDNTNGSTSGGNFIQVKSSRQTTETGAHEMGHTLGLDHNSSGLMTPSSNDPNRANTVNKSDVKDMIKYPTSGKVNSEYDSNGNIVNTGKGTVINNTNYSNDELKKGKL